MEPKYPEEMWQTRYAAEDYAYGRLPNTFLTTVTDMIPMGRVLCLAEGEGRNAVYLAQLGYQVTAVDASSNGIAKAQRLAHEHNVEIETIVGDLAEYSIGESQWQGIVAIFVHLPASLRQLVHRRVVNGLCPGGAYITEAYTEAQLKHRTGGPSQADVLMSLSVLREELPGLSIEVGREVERQIEEGIYHSGMSATVQVVAVRPT